MKKTMLTVKNDQSKSVKMYVAACTNNTGLNSELRVPVRVRRRMKAIRDRVQVQHDGPNEPDRNVCAMVMRKLVTTEVGPTDSISSSPTRSKADRVDALATNTSLASSSEGSAEKEGEPSEGIHVDSGKASGKSEKEDTTCVSHGWISVIGRRRAMEDTVTVVPGILAGEVSLHDFFAVYDGHGGASVSQACRDRMHRLLVIELEKWTRGDEAGRCDQIDWPDAMASCFKKMDDEVSCGGGGNGGGSGGVEKSCGGGGGGGSTGTTGPMATIGSTAVVVVVSTKKIVVANCGDSRAVLCRGGSPMPLSQDHKPDRPDERARVEAEGGKIINWNGYRVQGVLATSRSIGDHYLKPYVISEPEITVHEREKCDNFIIVASDGLWDVIPNEVACEIVGRCLKGQIKKRFAEELNGSYSMEAAAMLAELAMARGSKDNISVVVVELKKLSA